VATQVVQEVSKVAFQVAQAVIRPEHRGILERPRRPDSPAGVLASAAQWDPRAAR